MWPLHRRRISNVLSSAPRRAGGWLVKHILGTPVGGAASFLARLKYVDREPPPLAMNARTRSASVAYSESAFNWATNSSDPAKQRLNSRLRQAMSARFSSQAAT